MNNKIDASLLEILACPACHGEVRQDMDEIICIKCNRKYPVRNGIPVMLVDEAKK